MTRLGGCLCGTVRFEVNGEMGPVIACHCSQCRRQTGLYFTSGDVARSDIEIRDGGTLRWYRASDKAQRGFCSACGAPLFWQADGRAVISVVAGAFDQPSGLTIDHHIYCQDKADFYEITDGRPQYALYPGAG
ncbi:GFA family protein [Rhizobium sp. FY34]|uniref:GFA family protein n=1 Tax=Rhizobium sp. FY34 TaxID=2562309 RepID=UPI0010C06857|nr:GFA family protein [Rhizobium sp. FY34]